MWLTRPVYAAGIQWTDWATMVFAALLLLPIMRTGFKISRREGLIFVLLFAGYVAWLVLNHNG